MKLFFHEFGSGQPVIILHGLYGTSDNWVAFAKQLSGQFHVYIPDQRNHGRSPHHEDFNYEVLKDDLLDFIEGNKIKNPYIIGHSMGGKVVMNFVLNYPGKIAGLIVVDISPQAYPHDQYHNKLMYTMLAVDFTKVVTRHDVEKQLTPSIPDWRIRQFIMKNLCRKTSGKFAWRPNLNAISKNFDRIYEGISTASEYNGPTLFIKAGNSNYIVDEDTVLIKKLFPLAKIKTVENATHWIHADKPEEFYQLVFDFLHKKSNKVTG